MHHENIAPVDPNACLLCGSKLVSSGGTPTNETCGICQKTYIANAKCPNGHYICDSCCNADIFTRVERFVNASTEKDPIALAVKVFDLPGLVMHGVEYHSIAPAIIMAAYQNAKGYRDPAEIAEAIKRGKYVHGASCGFDGNCGAAVGSGIAVSIIEKANPMSREERGHAQAATGSALIELSKFGGPRCCKRETIATIYSFAKVTGYFSGIEISDFTCKQFRHNKECIHAKCPYFPRKKKNEQD